MPFHVGELELWEMIALSKSGDELAVFRLARDFSLKAGSGSPFLALELGTAKLQQQTTASTSSRLSWGTFRNDRSRPIKEF
jgi:hypothetical protein